MTKTNFLNKKSTNLIIVIPTYNRLNLLKCTIDSILDFNNCSLKIIVIDGGSTDGTVKYLKNNKRVTSIFQKKLIGAVKAENYVFKRINSKYVCYLNDDVAGTNNSFDIIVAILEKNKDIGLVSLKTIDIYNDPINYIGTVFETGIINCNFGVLPLKVLRDVGYFNEKYLCHIADNDLTASVLCTGKKCVITKKLCLYHYTEGERRPNENDELIRKKNVEEYRILLEKFHFLTQHNLIYKTKLFLGKLLVRIRKILGYKKYRDLVNLTYSKYVKIIDPIENRNKPFYFVQKIPDKILDTSKNPYRDVFKKYNKLI